MNTQRILRYILVTYAFACAFVIYSFSRLYGFSNLVFQSRTWNHYAVLFFIVSGIFAIVVLSYTPFARRIRKEAEQLGEPRKLLRDYCIIGFFIFVAVAPLAYFDVLHTTQLAITELLSHGLPGGSFQYFNVSQYESTDPVAYVYLSNLRDRDSEYLQACVSIVKDLKAAGAKAALMHVPEGFTFTADNYHLLQELKKADIGVLCAQPRNLDLWRKNAGWWVDCPNLFDIDVSWGVATAEATNSFYLHKFVPFEYRSNTGTLPASDIALEALRKYAGYSEQLVPQRRGGVLRFGDYQIPVFRGGFSYTRGLFGGDNRQVEAVFDKKASRIDYPTARAAYKDYSEQWSLTDICKDKIAIIIPFDEFSIERSFSLPEHQYARIISSIVTNDLVQPRDTWNEALVLISIALALWISYKLPPLDGTIVLALLVWIVLLAGFFILVRGNEFVETVYMGIALVFCAAFFSVGKLAHKNRIARSAMALELERKLVLESQKDRLEQEVAERTKELRSEKEETERLLYNILPVEIAKELREKGTTLPRRYEEVTILFTDFRGFTNTVAAMPAGRLVAELNDIFKDIDDIIDRHGIEKIKTIGDSYMVAAGLPKESHNHAVQCVRAALDMVRFIEHRNETSAIKWQMRVGIHSGAAVAGVVGKKKFTYDVWGDTVNIASRMETSGEPGKINISAFTYDLIKDHFDCQYRGKIDAKGKGEIDMYFVLGEKRIP